MDNLKNLYPIDSEEKMIKFLEQWQELIKINKEPFVAFVVNALDQAESYLELETIPFIIACLEHPRIIVRIAAVEALADVSHHKKSDEGIEVLLKLLASDSFDNRNSVAGGLGYIASEYQAQKIIPILLAVIKNSEEDHIVRKAAYKGTLFAALSEERYEEIFPPFDWGADYYPAKEKFDWEAIEEIEEKFQKG